MSSHHPPVAGAHPPELGGYEDHGQIHYVKVWAILVVLLIISVLGPLLGHPVVTLITAFGIACVKAFLVCKNFMHLNVQKPFVVYMLVTALVFMLLFFFAVAPDVMKHDGHNWTNVAANAETVRAEAAHAAGKSERQDGKVYEEAPGHAEGAEKHE